MYSGLPDMTHAHTGKKRAACAISVLSFLNVKIFDTATLAMNLEEVLGVIW